ncbi:MAG TPA: TetR/AcrR family transcriptional regulator [Cyclobacteriaceae bacterium]|nr:TetR/AcrR family transcriptional regulator [Cyclobacteriaceae bacterium]HRJ82729.1 TetR/AcrR family transcriptional regulator [Cyclobacteriaceae bacterium]
MEEQDVKDKILKGAEELFMRYGIRSISMDDIARHLAVSKKTLYQHFADKDDLVLLVSRGHLQRNRAEFEGIWEAAKNPIEELAKISACMRMNMETMNPTLLFDLQKFHPKAWSEWIGFKNKYIRENVVRNLAKGMEDGYIRPDINPEIMAAMRIELVQLAFNNEIFPPGQYKLAEVQEQIFDHFVYGLVTEKGKKLYQKCKTLNNQPSSVL